MRVLSICKMDQHNLASFLFSAKISIPAKILARSLATDPLSGTRQIFSEFSFSFDFFRTRQFIGEFTCLRPCLENSPRVTQPCNLARSPSLLITLIKFQIAGSDKLSENRLTMNIYQFMSVSVLPYRRLQSIQVSIGMNSCRWFAATWGKAKRITRWNSLLIIRKYILKSVCVRH